MPQYEYRCPHCRAITEEHKNVEDRDDTPICKYCPEECKTTRIMSVSMFKINGFSEANGYSNKL